MKAIKNSIKQHIKSLKAAQNCRYFIGAEPLYTAESIQSLNEQGQLFISRALQKLKQVKAVIAQQDSLSFEPLGNL